MMRAVVGDSQFQRRTRSVISESVNKLLIWTRICTNTKLTAYSDDRWFIYSFSKVNTAWQIDWLKSDCLSEHIKLTDWINDVCSCGCSQFQQRKRSVTNYSIKKWLIKRTHWTYGLNWWFVQLWWFTVSTKNTQRDKWIS